MHSSIKALRGVGLTSSVGIALCVGVAHAQLPGLTNQLLGRGEAEYASAVGGPADIALAKVTLDPGSRSGWHSHPGPGWVVVTAGQLSLYHADGCRSVYATGAAFLEEPGDVHDARNDTAEPVEFLVSFTLPSGSQMLTPSALVPTDCESTNR